jgi:hypothetical protein
MNFLGVICFLGMVLFVMGLVLLCAFLRRKTHCMECGGALDVPVWHCTHSREAA